MGAEAGGGLAQILFMLVAFGGIVYFLMIRPQQQQRKKHEEMVANMKRGDGVILQGGLYGKITKINDEDLEIEIAQDVVIRQVKSMILSVIEKPQPMPKKAASRASTAKSSTAKSSTTKAAPKKRTSRAKAADADQPDAE